MSIGHGINNIGGALESLRGRTDAEAVKAVAKEMEALFAYELLKAMRTAGEVSKEKGLGRETYMSMFDQELSRLLADRGIGLQQQLLRGLTRGETAPVRQESVQKPEAKAAAPASAPERPAQQADEPPAMPAEGRISSGYGMRRHPIHGDHRFHSGMDIAAPEGTEIRAVRSGKVVFSGRQPGYGNIVIIDHGDGVVTKYAHNQTNYARSGEEVAAGDVIAAVGSTGHATGPHLHFEVRVNGRSMDPAKGLAMLPGRQRTEGAAG